MSEDNDYNLWVLCNKAGESFINEVGMIVLFQCLAKALLFIKYETDNPDSWHVNEVAVDEDMFKNLQDHRNII